MEPAAAGRPDPPFSPFPADPAPRQKQPRAFYALFFIRVLFRVPRRPSRSRSAGWKGGGVV